MVFGCPKRFLLANEAALAFSMSLAFGSLCRLFPCRCGNINFEVIGAAFGMCCKVVRALSAGVVPVGVEPHGAVGAFLLESFAWFLYVKRLVVDLGLDVLLVLFRMVGYQVQLPPRRHIDSSRPSVGRRAAGAISLVASGGFLDYTDDVLAEFPRRRWFRSRWRRCRFTQLNDCGNLCQSFHFPLNGSSRLSV